MKSSQTRSIAIAAPPAAVLSLLADGARLPDWAPRFAREARAEGDHWVIDSGGVELRVRIRSSVELGTVDILDAAKGKPRAFGRVIPNGEGSEFLFTLLFDPGINPEVVEGQMGVVEKELEAVRDLTEAAKIGRMPDVAA
jgi:Polyketide cyclase / dehydrase and lipid transport